MFFSLSKPYYQPAGKNIDYKSAGKIEARNYQGKEDYQPAGKKGQEDYLGR